jgi:uncharacterized membrane protein
MIVGIVLCGLLELWLDHGLNSPFPAWATFNIANHPIFIDGFVALTCATLAITFYLAAIYGPWVGFVVGGAGTFIADLIAGSTGLFWYWDLGLALVGFIVGLTLLSASRSPGSTRNIGRIVRISVIATVLFTVVGELGSMVGYHVAFSDTAFYILAYSVLYSVASLIVLAILLKIYNSVVSQRSTP